MSDQKKGRLDMIIGPMFSGKTTELLTRISRFAVYKRVCIINSSSDIRNCGQISTHNVFYKNYDKLDIIIAEKLDLVDISSYDVIGVDEAQFFPDLYETVKRWLDIDKKEIIVVGLDGSWQRKEIGQILSLIPLCRTVKKKLSVCKECAKEGHYDEDAPYTAKIAGDQSIEKEIGGLDIYSPVCEYHFGLLTKNTT